MSEMQVVTVEGFARHDPDFEGHRGFIYCGDAWLFRFVIESEERFFRDQLPYLVSVFDIDPRQMYRLALYGQPGCGLGDVRLFISFEKPPDESALERLQIAPPRAETGHSGDILDNLLMDLLRTEPAMVKRGLSDALRRRERVTQRSLGKSTRGGNYIWSNAKRSRYGSVVRLQWTDELSPRAVDWSNLNFMLTEALRAAYDAKNVIRLDFRAIPETEHAYDIEVDVVVVPPVRLHPIRTRPKKKPRPLGMAKRTKSGNLQIFSVPDALHGLTESDREFRSIFNALPLEERIRFWEDHIALFFE